MERPGYHQRQDAQRRLSWWSPAVAGLVIAAQAVAICALWLDGLRRVRDAEAALIQVDRDISAMMMLIGTLQDRQDKQDTINKAVSDWMLEASKNKR